MVSAFAAAANANVASRTAANSLTLIACRIVLDFIVILLVLLADAFLRAGVCIVPSLSKAESSGTLAQIFVKFSQLVWNGRGSYVWGNRCTFVNRSVTVAQNPAIRPNGS